MGEYISLHLTLNDMAVSISRYAARSARPFHIYGRLSSCKRFEVVSDR